MTSISMSLEPNPPPPPATVMVPASSRSATAACTSSRRATWSASGSVVIEYVMPLPPPVKASRSAEPLEPIETCTVSMPSMSSRIVLDLVDAASSASRLGAAPMSWVIVKVFWPESPRKFVFMNGAAAIVPTSTSTASSRVTHECFSVQRRIGRYDFCRRLGGAAGSSGSISRPSASRIGLPGRRNQYASTGHDRERDEQRRRHRDRDGQRERAEQLARDVADEGDRQEHRDRRDGRRRDGGRDLADGAQDRLHLVGVADVVALDVLDHDDRVVDHAPDRDRERAERQDVQRVAERLDADERDQHARRDRDRRDERRAHRQQEHEDDEHGEEEAEQALLGERLDRLLDVGRLVEDDRELGAVEALLEVGEHGEHALRHVDGVRRGKLRDRDREGRLAVDARDRRDRVLLLLDGRDIRDRDGAGLELLGASEGTSGSAAISSTDVIFEPVCTVRVWPSSVISPPGNSTPFWSSASRIACWV